MSTTEEPSRRLTATAWRTYSEWPLVAIGVVFVVAYSIEVIDDLHGAAARPYDIAIWATWVLFAADYVVNLVLAERRGWWFVRNLHELAILVLPVLRPLRLLRLLFVLRITHRAAERHLRGRVLVYAFGGATLITYLAALAVLDAEQNHRAANIHSIGDAWWWAATTITSVGYGDYYPVTLVGRIVAVGLMVGGVALVGVTAATMATWLIDQVGSRVDTQLEKAERSDDDLRERLDAMGAQLAKVTELLEGERGGGLDTPPGAAARPAQGEGAALPD
ncbi:potassium channel family protein [Pseudolysinimonas kribbensis]|uniref:potassium channel family protein n=1 Tax=Pseudolysinimonas kribbensis TaxID=433641 RepID=UPI0031CF9742